MLKILYNENANDNNQFDLYLTINNTYVKAQIVSSVKEDLNGFDVIKCLESYHSYMLLRKGTKVKINRRNYPSCIRWLDMNRVDAVWKMDFGQMIQLFDSLDFCQIDTGMISEDVNDIVIRIWSCPKSRIHIVSNIEYELEPFNDEKFVLSKQPRFTLWDYYSLDINGRELKANDKGFIIDGDFETPFVLDKGKDYFDCTIRKYTPQFGEPLTRNIDDEEVFVDCSVGLANIRRVSLKNGVGHFRIYPFGATGKVHIKLGRKWYEVWNDYTIQFGENE